MWQPRLKVVKGPVFSHFGQARWVFLTAVPLLGIWNLNLALFSQSEVAIPSKMDMLELYHVMKLHDILSSS